MSEYAGKWRLSKMVKRDRKRAAEARSLERDRAEFHAQEVAASIEECRERSKRDFSEGTPTKE